jgi:hypothetical protein
MTEHTSSVRPLPWGDGLSWGTGCGRQETARMNEVVRAQAAHDRFNGSVLLAKD